MPFKFVNSLILLLFLSSGCSDSSQKTRIKIAFNPWPGYEFLYLAQETGLFKKYNLNIELVELSSLSDTLRVYEHGHVDGMASTVIEAVLAVDRTQEALDVVLVTDYSNGGDMIIAAEDIKSVEQLKGKKVGTELGSLGVYVLAAALEKHKLELEYVETINAEQLEVLEVMKSGEVDAVVTYPPFSVEVLKLPGTKRIFTSKETPGQVIDIVSIKKSTLAQLPNDWLARFYLMWDEALAYAKENPEHAYQTMAIRQGVPVEEFTSTLNDILLMNAEQSHNLLNNGVSKNLSDVCELMDYNNQLITNCADVLKHLSPVIKSE